MRQKGGAVTTTPGAKTMATVAPCGLRNGRSALARRIEDVEDWDRRPQPLQWRAHRLRLRYLMAAALQ
ncbi:hypothetical protein OsJ_34011 [Oryza sativa Japonica Group]|nr:hypothetical protein OsJ_34011 [Oryza sativa Japonica Group]